MVREDGTLGSALRLLNPQEGSWGWDRYYVKYYRDGGDWSVSIRVTKEGKVYSVNSYHHLINLKEMVGTTYWDWKKDNGPYTNKKTKAYKL